MGVEFYIDKITACIEDVSTGKLFDTEMLVVDKHELKDVLKKNGWNFSWKGFSKISSRQLYKLVIRNDKGRQIQGLLSLEIKDDFIELHHIENAPHNIGSRKHFAGVCANMVAFACKLSFDLGFDGVVAFYAKSSLIPHYEATLGAELIFPPQRMAIFTESARILVNSYYKNYFNAQEE